MQLLHIGVNSGVSRHGIIRAAGSSHSVVVRCGDLGGALDPPSDDAADEHGAARGRAGEAVVGAAAAGGGPDAVDFGALEAVADDGADAAGRYGAAQAGGGAGAERAGEGGAVEAEQLVAVGGAAGVALGGGGGAYLDGVSVVLESLDGALRVVDFENAFDLADWVVLFLPA